MPEWLLRLLAGGICYDTPNEGEDAGGDPKTPKTPKTPVIEDADDDEDDDDTALDTADAKKKDEIIRRLRRENQRYRTNAKTFRTELDQVKSGQKSAIETAVADALKTAGNASKETATALITDSETKANNRLIRQEQKRALEASGCVDIETGLKIIDASGISVNDDGEVLGIADAITKLKEKKAYLFKAGSTTSTFGKPSPAAPKGFNAVTASQEERKARAAQLGIPSL